MNFNTQISIKNQEVVLPELSDVDCQIIIKREDQIHPLVSGNKFRKLKYNIQEAVKQKHTTLLTFGGAFSNHILATAAAGNLKELQTVGVIRGDELGINSSKTLEANPTLRTASELGMKFEFVSREEYRNKTSARFLHKLQEKYEDFYLIPEGGTNDLAVKGCEEILEKEDDQFNYICSCVGTGGTISGIINSAQKHQKILGFPALKGSFLKNDIQRYSKFKDNWELINDYHFGGYGKYSDELIHFMNRFKKITQIPLDPIYTGKMMFGVVDMIKNKLFPAGSKILIIHTGGLQGIDGFNELLMKKKSDLKIF